MKTITLVLCLLLTVSLLTGCHSASVGIIGGADGPTAIFVSKEPEISAAEAQAIALQHAGLAEEDVSFLRTELDRDDGILRYEVDFRRDKTEYDYEINAETGEVLSFEQDR